MTHALMSGYRGCVWLCLNAAMRTTSDKHPEVIRFILDLWRNIVLAEYGGPEMVNDGVMIAIVFELLNSMKKLALFLRKRVAEFVIYNLKEMEKTNQYDITPLIDDIGREPVTAIGSCLLYQVGHGFEVLSVVTYPNDLFYTSHIYGACMDH
ncbi:hypothetical protein Tco_1107188 [Tanacetum coccineum]